MRPACSFDDPSAFIEMMKTRIAIRLQNAGEAEEVLLRIFALAIFRVGEPYRSWRIVSSRAVIAYIGPEPRRLRSARAWRQHRHRRVVGMQLRGREYMAPELINERVGRLAGISTPWLPSLLFARPGSAETRVVIV